MGCTLKMHNLKGAFEDLKDYSRRKVFVMSLKKTSEGLLPHWHQPFNHLLELLLFAKNVCFH